MRVYLRNLGLREPLSPNLINKVPAEFTVGPSLIRLSMVIPPVENRVLSVYEQAAAGGIYNRMKNGERAVVFQTARARPQNISCRRAMARVSRHRNVSSLGILCLIRDRATTRRRTRPGRDIPMEYNPLNAVIYSSIRSLAYLVSLVKPLMQVCAQSARGKV